MLVGDVLLAVDQTPVESPEELMDLMMATGADRQLLDCMSCAALPQPN